MRRSARVVVVGGGIAGLATALELKDRAATIPDGLEVQLLEGGARPGGRVQTEHCDGFTIEQGPTGFLDDAPPTMTLIERLGLTAELQWADEAASRRFLFRNGRLHAVPSGPVAFFKSPILSRRARLRAFLEPFVPAAPQDADESVHEFASRRLGVEAADVLADALASGLYAGDARALSLASTFPGLAALEAEHGSLVRGLIARRRRMRSENGGTARSRSPAGRLTSFRRGLGTLIDGLTVALDGAVRCEERVTTLERVAEITNATAAGGAYPWRVTTAAGSRIDADAVIVAAASREAAALLTKVDPTLGRTLDAMPTVALAVVALGFETRTTGSLPAGFGFLAPHNQGLRTLGCVWDSSVFAGRAPAGTILLRCILGGARDVDAARADDETLVAFARRDLETAMGITEAPIFSRVYRHASGIAQYVRGHGERLCVIGERLRALPGLWVTGSSYYGVGLNACVERAHGEAREIAAFLAASWERPILWERL
jgi:oxygen-dependent protoporphyrinogen oxidase